MEISKNFQNKNKRNDILYGLKVLSFKKNLIVLSYQDSLL